jgi:inner membrane transporter RhtA
VTSLRVAAAGRGPVLAAGGLISVSTLSASLAAALSVSLFAAVPAGSVSALRLVASAIFLCLLCRPRLGDRPASEWVAIGGFGIGMAGISLCLHEAMARIPMGVAITIEFLGPCAVALAASKRVLEGLTALAALAGVALMAGPGGTFDLVGFGFAVAAAVFLGFYTVFAEKVGKSEGGLGNLALSVVCAALLSLPFATWTTSFLNPKVLGVLAGSAALGVVVPYLLDTIAAKVAGARVIGTLFAMDPVMGTLVGVTLAGQALTLPTLAGMALVVGAGGALVWLSGRPAAA